MRRSNEIWIFVIAFALSMLGLLMVFSSSLVVTASSGEFGADPYFFVKRQAIYFCLGLFCLAQIRRLDLEHWRPLLSLPFLGVNLVLLILVLLIGPEINGAQRWIMLGPIQFQPAELAKLAIIFYMADFLARRGEKIRSFHRLLPALVLFAVVMMLIERQPDLGTALAIGGTFFAMLYVSGARVWHLLALCGTGVFLVLCSVAIKPYRLKRITSFLDPDADPQGAGYHAIQSLLAIGSGGLTGRGFGVGHQKYKYLPEAHTDYIFAILGEELGLVGTVAVVFLFLALLYKGFQIALHCRQPYLRLLAVGTSFQLVLQAFLNIGVVTAVTPSTGIPLPFISYGGTSLLFSLIGIGILMNIAEQSATQRHARVAPQEKVKEKRAGATLTSSSEESLEAVSSGIWEKKAAGQRLRVSQQGLPRPAVEIGLLNRNEWGERRKPPGPQKRSRRG